MHRFGNHEVAKVHCQIGAKALHIARGGVKAAESANCGSGIVVCNVLRNFKKVIPAGNTGNGADRFACDVRGV